MADSVPVKPGWDIFPKLASGDVSLDTTVAVQLRYSLSGAEANQAYQVGFDIFNLPDPGVNRFGVQREMRARTGKEGTSAVIDVFRVGEFRTDGAGDGNAVFDLVLAGVPSGTYDLQLWWSRPTPDLGGLPAYYRTGNSFGQGFVKVTVP